jgi:invasion protein IalB
MNSSNQSNNKKRCAKLSRVLLTSLILISLVTFTTGTSETTSTNLGELELVDEGSINLEADLDKEDEELDVNAETQNTDVVNHPDDIDHNLNVIINGEGKIFDETESTSGSIDDSDFTISDTIDLSESGNEDNVVITITQNLYLKERTPCMDNTCEAQSNQIQFEVQNLEIDTPYEESVFNPGNREKIEFENREHTQVNDVYVSGGTGAADVVHEEDGYYLEVNENAEGGDQIEVTAEAGIVANDEAEYSIEERDRITDIIIYGEGGDSTVDPDSSINVEPKEITYSAAGATVTGIQVGLKEEGSTITEQCWDQLSTDGDIGETKSIDHQDIRDYTIYYIDTSLGAEGELTLDTEGNECNGGGTLTINIQSEEDNNDVQRTAQIRVKATPDNNNRPVVTDGWVSTNTGFELGPDLQKPLEVEARIQIENSDNVEITPGGSDVPLDEAFSNAGYECTAPSLEMFDSEANSFKWEPEGAEEGINIGCGNSEEVSGDYTVTYNGEENDNYEINVNNADKDSLPLGTEISFTDTRDEQLNWKLYEGDANGALITQSPGNEFSYTFEQSKSDTDFILQTVGENGPVGSIELTTEEGDDGGSESVSIEGPDSVEVGDSASFEANPSEYEDSAYEWDIENGPDSATGKTISHTWENSGNKEVELDLYTGDNTVEDSKTVEVTEENNGGELSVGINGPDSASKGQQVEFEATDLPDNYDSIEWSINGQTESTSETLTNSWSSTGTYTIEVTLENNGNSDTATHTIGITEEGGGGEEPDPEDETFIVQWDNSVSGYGYLDTLISGAQVRVPGNVCSNNVGRTNMKSMATTFEDCSQESTLVVASKSGASIGRPVDLASGSTHTLTLDPRQSDLEPRGDTVLQFTWDSVSQPVEGLSVLPECQEEAAESTTGSSGQVTLEDLQANCRVSMSKEDQDYGSQVVPKPLIGQTMPISISGYTKPVDVSVRWANPGQYEGVSSGYVQEASIETICEGERESHGTASAPKSVEVGPNCLVIASKGEAQGARPITPAQLDSGQVRIPLDPVKAGLAEKQVQLRVLGSTVTGGTYSVEGATVNPQCGYESKQTVSDGTAIFDMAISDLPCEIEASKAEASSRIYLTRGPSQLTIPLDITKEKDVTLNVRDSNGNPVEEAEVTTNEGCEASGSTDTSGTTTLQIGQNCNIATAQKQEATAISPINPTGRTSITLQEPEPTSLVVRTVSARGGDPITGAEISSPTCDISKRQTNEAGEVRLDLEGKGSTTCTILAEHDGSSKIRPQPSDLSQNLVFRFQEPRSVNINVEYSTGSPVEGAEVTTNEGCEASGSTDTSGTTTLQIGQNCNIATAQKQEATGTSPINPSGTTRITLERQVSKLDVKVKHPGGELVEDANVEAPSCGINEPQQTNEAGETTLDLEGYESESCTVLASYNQQTKGKPAPQRLQEGLEMILPKAELEEMTVNVEWKSNGSGVGGANVNLCDRYSGETFEPGFTNLEMSKNDLPCSLTASKAGISESTTVKEYSKSKKIVLEDPRKGSDTDVTWKPVSIQEAVDKSRFSECGRAEAIDPESGSEVLNKYNEEVNGVLEPGDYMLKTTLDCSPDVATAGATGEVELSQGGSKVVEVKQSMELSEFGCGNSRAFYGEEGKIKTVQLTGSGSIQPNRYLVDASSSCSVDLPDVSSDADEFCSSKEGYKGALYECVSSEELATGNYNGDSFYADGICSSDEAVLCEPGEGERDTDDGNNGNDVDGNKLEQATEYCNENYSGLASEEYVCVDSSTPPATTVRVSGSEGGFDFCDNQEEVIACDP